MCEFFRDWIILGNDREIIYGLKRERNTSSEFGVGWVTTFGPQGSQEVC